MNCVWLHYCSPDSRNKDLVKMGSDDRVVPNPVVCLPIIQLANFTNIEMESSTHTLRERERETYTSEKRDE